MANPYNKYLETSIKSASREKILLMLYEACIRFMKQAVKAIDEKKIADRGTNILRAMDIVNELLNTLNHEVGKEIAANLEQLYIFVNDQLTKSNISGEKKPLEDAIKVMETLYSGWVEAIEKLKREESLNNK